MFLEESIFFEYRCKIYEKMDDINGNSWGKKKIRIESVCRVIWDIYFIYKGYRESERGRGWGKMMKNDNR